MSVLSDSEIVELARVAHAGQQDKLGRDYFTAHLAPIAAGAAPFGSVVVQAAWLHDTVEDTSYTVERLQSAGVAAEVVAGVEAVTRRADETYAELIGRACADPVGRLVKLVDNGWNIACNPELAERDPVRAASMLQDRYLPARRRLLAASGLAVHSPAVMAMQEALEAQRVALGALEGR